MLLFFCMFLAINSCHRHRQNHQMQRYRLMANQSRLHRQLFLRPECHRRYHLIFFLLAIGLLTGFFSNVFFGVFITQNY